jgi:hypothetical protein
MAKRLNGVNPALAATRPAGQCKVMTDQHKSREERLAKALRENLRKRKEQARQTEKSATSDDAPSPTRR